MANVSRRAFIALSAGAFASLVACGKSENATDATGTGDSKSARTPYAFRFASADEGAKLIVGNESYNAQMSQLNIDFRLQKVGGTLDDWKDFATKQVLEFTDDEKASLKTAMAKIEGLITERNLNLPDSEEIVFIKTTMAEECYASAYTHGTQIYLNDAIVQMLNSDDQVIREESMCIIAHELFHCLTRSNPDFRAKMYSILGFEVQDEDFEFGTDVAGRIICNPDVEHHNSHATFTIDGLNRPCAVVFYASQPFEKEGDNFFDLGKTGLVPTDDLNTLYDSTEASNFWDVFGRNTDYVIDPEETMADNFSFAVVYGRNGTNYKNPEIIEAIFEKLS
ncbi:MAG: hypothetical protein Q4C09_06595 [Atopobiaceae bacterium]|nr:hypothetical protein [Atopobiaceae bacterium]